MNFKTIITLGPSILNEKKVKEIDSYGDCIYRINGAHVGAKEFSKLVNFMRDVLPTPKIMIDLPGNKIRTTNLSDPVRLVKGETFTLYNYQINYPELYKHLKKGDVVLANDSVYTFEISEVSEDAIQFLSLSDGLLLSNKGLHVKGIHKDIPFLFEKDHNLIDMACTCGVNYLSLSFVRNVNDILEVKKKINGKCPHIIAKVETLSALENLDNIFDEVESVLVDRGDLSTEIGMLELASAQEKVIATGIKKGKNVYLATQFLKNMETKPVPLISEVIDLYKTVKSGIAGVQLSEETAIGKYSIDCVKMVFEVFKHVFEKELV